MRQFCNRKAGRVMPLLTRMEEGLSIEDSINISWQPETELFLIET